MKWTKTLIQTLRDNPQDAEIDSHKLLMRAGICRKTASGLFTFMPLGMRTLREDGMLKVASGMTSLQEVLRVTMGDAD